MNNDAAERSVSLAQATAEESLRQSEQRFRALVSASTDVIYCMSPDWQELKRLDGRGRMLDTDQPRYNWIEEYIDPVDQPQVWAAIKEAIRTKSVFELEHRVRKMDGSLGWTLSRAVPILDDDGEIVEWFGAASDVTARRQSLEDIAAMHAELSRQKRFYESLISSTPDLIYAFDRDYRFNFANRALLEMWGKSFDESVGKKLIENGYEPWHAEMHEREIDQILATKLPIRGEVAFPHAVLGRRVYDYIFTPVFDAAGEVETIAGTTRDITEIRRAEEHLKLLINELNHRVKNTLATIQSIAAQTFRGNAAEPQAKAAFEARLMALSDVHTLLTGTNWESANLREIASRALMPFQTGANGQDRIVLNGHDIQLRPQGALALAMAFHELASNAVKYGALSSSAGLVKLAWRCDDDRLYIEWRETGGPQVEPPRRRGFGSRLIEQGLARELNGSVELHYHPEGVVCAIDIPKPQEGSPE